VADELKNEGGDNQFWIEQYGKVLALETLVVTLLASHARTFPNGVAAQMLGDPNAAAKEYGRIMGADGSDLPAGYLTRAKEEAIQYCLSSAQLTIDAWDEKADENH